MAEAGSKSPHLDEEEQDQAAERAPLSSTVIHEVIRKEGEAELDREPSQLLWSGLAAGLSMGFSYLVQAELRAGLPDAPWRHLVASFGYATGFLIVVLGRQQLFTESTLTAVLPVLTQRKLDVALKCLRLWALVLAANLAGTWIFAAVLAYGHPVQPEVMPALAQMASETAEGDFGGTVLKAAFAGWLIGLMVWLLPSAGAARPIIILLLTYVVSLGHLAHIVAGSAEAAFGVLVGQASIGDYFGAFVLPTLIGNTIGGALLVGLLNHAPVRKELNGGAAG